jgi:hypothetical protein
MTAEAPTPTVYSLRASRRSPGSLLRCVVLGGVGGIVNIVRPTSDKHIPVLQQDCQLVGTGLVQTAGQGPDTGGGIIEFRTGDKAPNIPCCGQHLSVVEQRRGKPIKGMRQAPGQGPGPCRRIVELRARK